MINVKNRADEYFKENARDIAGLMESIQIMIDEFMTDSLAFDESISEDDNERIWGEIEKRLYREVAK